MKSVSELVAAVDPSFQEAVKKYRLKTIKNEFYGEDFKDSEVNIFIKNKYPFLMELIGKYSEIKDFNYACNYSQAFKEITDFLKEQVHPMKKSIDQRIRMVAEKEKKELRSISFFLNELIDKLNFENDIIDKCLIPFSDYVKELSNNGMTINEDPDFILFYLNKCVLLSHTTFFKDDCVNGLMNLNKRVIGRNAYRSEALFRLGTLDFNFHFYDESKKILKKLIEQLEKELMDCDDDEKKYMLFSSYLMYVTSYEFTGDYISALAILFGLEPDSVQKSEICSKIIQSFENALKKKNKVLDDLLFSTADETEKKSVIILLNDIFENNIFEGRMARFAYNNGAVFSRLIDRSNTSFYSDFDLVREEFRGTTYSQTEVDLKRTYTPTDADLRRVREHFRQTAEKNKPMHDYLHILSHCLNEQATAILANDQTGYNGEARDLMILARALMLYVSENHEYYENASLYKTCYATVFAEAGDYSIANASLKDFQKKEYSKLGVDSKAEINFYYYLISRIDSINNGRAVYVDDEKDECYNHFLNCCYRNFDFDAIAHMSLLSVEYYIATILQQNDLSELKKIIQENEFFTDKIKNKIKDIGKSGHNIWLSNERRKVNYMYQFLRLFFSTENQKYSRTPQIYEIASKYLYYSNINTIVDSERISYIDYTDKEKLLESIKEILDSYSFGENYGNEYYRLSVGNCVYVSLKEYSNRSYKKLGDEINSSQGLFFVHSASEKKQEMKEELANICNGEEMRLRFFDDEIGALREFFLFCVFERIRNDFVSPNGLFVMTPVHNAEPCKYQVTDFMNLTSEVYERIGSSQFKEEEVDDQAQYEASGINRRILSAKWINRLQGYSKDIIWAATLMVKKDSFDSRHSYSYIYPGDKLKTAVLLNPEQCYDLLNRLWKRRQICHSKICNTNTERCQNNTFSIYTNNLVDKRQKDNLQKLFLSMPELQWKKIQSEYPTGTLIIWKHESGQYTIWRLVAVKTSKNTVDKEEDSSSILIKICNRGDDIIFQSTQKNSTEKWPSPINIESANRFVFISHLATAGDLLKKELNDCLEKNHVNYWYDKELIVTDEWKKKISKVIHHPNCVGAILFITDEMFFKSDSIGYELNEFIKKKSGSEEFKVIPIVYNCYSEDQFEEIFRSGYSNFYNRESVRDLLGISNQDRKKILLNTWYGETLSEYTERERNIEGKEEGALMYALAEMKVLAL